MTPRSWLYVPGDRPDRITKALAGDADAVVIDLEDAVPAASKEQALENALEAVAETSGPTPLWVRMNALGTPWAERESQALAAAGAGLAGVRLPKAEDSGLVQRLADLLPCPVHLLIESARGLMRIPELAACHAGVQAVMLGEADLAADLRVGRQGLAWARGWLVATTRAAGLDSPVQSVWTDVADLDGLRRSSLEGRELGFRGRSVIHPRQVPVVNEACSPTTEEVTRAQEILDAAQQESPQGDGAILLPDGRFVDPAVVAQARLVLSMVHPDD